MLLAVPLMVITVSLPLNAHAEKLVHIDGKDINVEEISKKMLVMQDGSLVFRTEDSQTGVVFPNGAVKFLVDEDRISLSEGKTVINGRERPYVIQALPPVFKQIKTEVFALSPRSFCRDSSLSSLPSLCAPGKQFVMAERCIKTKGQSFLCLKNEIDS